MLQREINDEFALVSHEQVNEASEGGLLGGISINIYLGLSLSGGSELDKAILVLKKMETYTRGR